MQETNSVRHVHADRVQVIDQGIAPEERHILATVPSRTRAECNATRDLDPETYRQAFKVILGTPEIESRLPYITATMIVTVFGGWLAAKAVSSRTFAMVTSTALLFLGAAVAGALIGVLLGESFLPEQTIPLVLLAMTGVVLFLLGILIGAMAPGESRIEPQNTWESRPIAATVRERRTLRRRNWGSQQVENLPNRNNASLQD